MARMSKIVQLGIENLVKELYEETGDYTETQKVLASHGYDVSMVQIRNFLKSEGIYDNTQDIVPIGDKEDLQYTPIGQLINYEPAASIFDIGQVLESNYKYLVEMLKHAENIPQALGILKEMRASGEFVGKVIDKLAAYNEYIQFQQDVLSVFADVDPKVQQKLLESLRRRRALRYALDYKRSD